MSAITPPVADDLAANVDVQITPAIQALATQLNHNPVQIYNWVHDNIEFAPTYGSIQGSDETLQSLHGNAYDTASLLIARILQRGQERLLKTLVGIRPIAQQTPERSPDRRAMFLNDRSPIRHVPPRVYQMSRTKG